ncbi:acetyltransferase [bacterium]|nr:acetyltransferase [bacterium]
MNKNIIFIGGGGHSLVCAEIVNQHQDYKLVGFIDKNNNAILSESGYIYLGDDKILRDVIKKNSYFFITIGQIKNPSKRIEMFEKILSWGGEFPVLMSNNCYISPSAQIGKGTIIMNGSVVNAKSIVGENCIINSNALIEHEVIIESHVHIAPSAIILGKVVIKYGSFIGAGAIIREGVIIEKNSIIAAGEKVMFNKF